MTPVLEKPYETVSINPENINFLHFTNGGHTRKSIMAAPMFLRIKSSIRQELFEEMETVIKSFYPDLAFFFRATALSKAAFLDRRL